jgi:rod shape determining protein RodA
MKSISRLSENILPASTTDEIQYANLWQRLHLDLPLLFGIIVLMVCGLFILYSAGDKDITVVEQQAVKFAFALLTMFILAQIPPVKYRLWAPWLYLAGVLLLIAVLVVGESGQGAKRWLNLGILRFQPSEMMKLALPMMLAWFFHFKPLPPKILALFIATILILAPTLLTAKEPDLGTAILIASGGLCIFLFAGIRLRILILLGLLVLSGLPMLWHFMREYQRQRVLTFLNPERDPLGAGYHIIQSKIAIGSGGIFGKGWLHGTQSHLSFLPEHATDFIFAVTGEELGLIGGIALIVIYMFIVFRCFYIASLAQDTFTRLLAGSLTLAFFLSMFINIGMVIGILPVVGVPLPLVSYGGTSVVAMLAGFGMIMSIKTHRKKLGL